MTAWDGGSIGGVPLFNAANRAQVERGNGPRVRGPSNFEVMEVTGVETDISHGIFDTIDEARGCVEYDKLTAWEIWQGDHIVERSPEEVIGGPGWRNGQPPRPLGEISHDAEALIKAVRDSAFACGEWTNDDDEPYQKLTNQAEAATAALETYIADLEVRAAGGRSLPFTLTPRDLFAIHAGLEVGRGIDEEEPWPGLDDAIAKITAIVADLQKDGVERSKPETSAQSQAYIDGAAPFRYEADGAEQFDDSVGVVGALNSQYEPEHEAPALPDGTGDHR